MTAQEYERAWWGTCINTWFEEQKHQTYATCMGLIPIFCGETFPAYELRGVSVLDVGGGPVSMLLKCLDGGRMTVLDPLPVPAWVLARYELAGIEYMQHPAETFRPTNQRGSRTAPESWSSGWDEAWIYNVLQHVADPQAVVVTARRYARRVRIFDWIETPPHAGHPNTLHAEELDKWLGGCGTTGPMPFSYGLAYWGVFKGDQG